MAPIEFSYGDDGSLAASRSNNAGSAGYIALVGDFQKGVAGYDVVGGNALLPSRPVPAGLIPVSTPLISVPGVLGLAAQLPGVVPNALTAATALLTAGLDQTLAVAGSAAPPLATLPVPSTVVAPVTGAVGGIAGGVVGGVVGAVGSAGAPTQPILAPVTAGVAPVTAAVEPAVTTLVIQGAGLLAGSAPPPAPPPTVTALAGGAVNGVLSALRRGP